mmetsp:Transcript_33094/g.95148  ORF Transcript_33094/g.95148 Transcript_33094/m.95148 type:complete len:100 (-) Transcript_33094:51-350(-)
MTAQVYALAQEGELGAAMQAALGAPDLAAYAAWGDPLAMAKHIAAASTEEEQESLEARWRDHLSCLPCRQKAGPTSEADASEGIPVEEQEEAPAAEPDA